MAIRNEVKDMLRANVHLIESRFPVSNQIQSGLFRPLKSLRPQ
jgi:hypothetical protein